MTVSDPISIAPTARHTQGILVLVMGPSGAGKDTLLKGAAAKLVSNPAITFARRVITRPVFPGDEQHLPLSEATFVDAEAKGGFALTWRAHGFRYGIPSTAVDRVRDGQIVVASVSRSVIDQARRLGLTTVILHVTASRTARARRLADRGREDVDAIMNRLDRNILLAPDDIAVIEIVNDRDIDAGIKAFVAELTGLTRAPSMVPGAQS